MGNGMPVTRWHAVFMCVTGQLYCYGIASLRRNGCSRAFRRSGGIQPLRILVYGGRRSCLRCVTNERLTRAGVFELSPAYESIDSACIARRVPTVRTGQCGSEGSSPIRFDWKVACATYAKHACASQRVSSPQETPDSHTHMAVAMPPSWLMERCIAPPCAASSALPCRR